MEFDVVNQNVFNVWNSLNFSSWSPGGNIKQSLSPKIKLWPVWLALLWLAIRQQRQSNLSSNPEQFLGSFFPSQNDMQQKSSICLPLSLLFFTLLYSWLQTMLFLVLLTHKCRKPIHKPVLTHILTFSEVSFMITLHLFMQACLFSSFWASCKYELILPRLTGLHTAGT